MTCESCHNLGLAFALYSHSCSDLKCERQKKKMQGRSQSTHHMPAMGCCKICRNQNEQSKEIHLWKLTSLSILWLCPGPSDAALEPPPYGSSGHPAMILPALWRDGSAPPTGPAVPPPVQIRTHRDLLVGNIHALNHYSYVEPSCNAIISWPHIKCSVGRTIFLWEVWMGPDWLNSDPLSCEDYKEVEIKTKKVLPTYMYYIGRIYGRFFIKF